LQSALARKLGHINEGAIWNIHLRTWAALEEYGERILSICSFNACQHEFVTSILYATIEIVNGLYFVQPYNNDRALLMRKSNAF